MPDWLQKTKRAAAALAAGMAYNPGAGRTVRNDLITDLPDENKPDKNKPDKNKLENRYV